MTPATRALLSIPLRPVPGVALLGRLAEGETVDPAEMEAAFNEAAQVAYRTRKVVERWSELKPTAAPTPPPGF